MKKLIYHKDKYLLVADAADELTAKQFIALAGLLHSSKNGLQQSLKALQILTNKNWFDFMRIADDAKLYALEHIEWVLEDWNLSKQLLPVYKKYHGPKSELDNITLSEFYCSELYYSELVKDNGEEALDKLVAVLYRKAKPFYNLKKDKDGDARKEFNANTLSYFAAKISRWPLNVKQAILLWYDGCRKQIADNNPDIFNGDGSNSENDSDMFGILRSLAGGKYGDFQKVEKMFLHTALMEMSLTIAENKRMEAELKKAR